MKDVKFSVQLSARRSTLEDWESLKSVVLDCEELGYYAVWFGDHLTSGYHPIWPGDPRLECWTILSALSTLTKRIRLGTMVLNNNFRNPALLAKMAATLDVISQGRLECGLGAGGYREELESYGFTFPSPRVRIERLREAVEIIKRMWIEEKPSYQGKHYRIKNAICEPKPIQKPHPPITIAGSGEKYTLSVVAAHADCWNPHPLTPMDQYIHKLKVLEGYCSQIGRDHREIEKSYHIFLSGLHHDEEESIQSMKRAYEDSSESHDTSFEEWFEAIRSRYILGTSEESLKKIQSIINLGVTHFVIGSSRQNTKKRRENLRLFSEEIITRLKEDIIPSTLGRN